MDSNANKTGGKAHALLGASSAHRWLNCAPSARMEEQLPDRPSVFAEEGTCAHALCAKQLKMALGLDCAEEDAELAELAPRHMSQEMQEAADYYCDVVLAAYRQARAASPDAVIRIEQRVDYSRFVPDGFGTADAVIVSDDGMQVFDFKFGKGVPVDAKGNPQMMLYALGALEIYGFGFGVEDVRMTIVQPRLDALSSWSVSAGDLAKWGEEEVKPAARRAYAGEGEPAPGEWCRFCRAQGRCRALALAALSLEPHATEASLLSPAEIADLLPKCELARKWADALEGEALSRALRGQCVPGYKLVAGRSARKISDQLGAISALCDAGYEEGEVVKPMELRGFGELEKALGKEAVASILGPYITKAAGKPVLAPESDRRKAIKVDALDSLDLD